MSRPPEAYPQICPVGEAAVLVELGDRLDRAINQKVFTLDGWLAQSPLAGVTAQVPGYCSLLVSYDPQQLTYDRVTDWLAEGLQSCPAAPDRQPRQVTVPVLYGGGDGPDLAEVARRHGMSPAEVVRRHTAPVYTVGMMGFTPGFAYLLGLDPELATPRLENPRTLVPRGSVGIAGGQTGIYPLESPGGWQLIGRTAQALYDPVGEPHFLLAPGDELRFVAAKGSVVR